MTVVMPEIRPVVYRRHGCGVARHRAMRALVECVWPRSSWVAGWGVWVTVSRCRRTTTTVHLWPTEAEARQGLEQIGAYGCGSRCVQRHQLVRLADDLVSGVTR